MISGGVCEPWHKECIYNNKDEINVICPRWMPCFRHPSVDYSPITPPGISIISLPINIHL